MSENQGNEVRTPVKSVVVSVAGDRLERMVDEAIELRRRVAILERQNLAMRRKLEKEKRKRLKSYASMFMEANSRPCMFAFNESIRHLREALKFPRDLDAGAWPLFVLELRQARRHLAASSHIRKLYLSGYALWISSCDFLYKD